MLSVIGKLFATGPAMKQMNATPLDSLINALRDNREGLRQFAIRRLVKIGQSVVPQLIQELKDKDTYGQEGAAIVLVTLGSAAVPALLQAMHHEDHSIRWGATWVLSSMPLELRRQIPAVKLSAVPQAVTTTSKASESGLHGVWSDSWLTKVRQNLEANKAAVLSLSPEAKPLGGAC